MEVLPTGIRTLVLVMYSYCITFSSFISLIDDDEWEKDPTVQNIIQQSVVKNNEIPRYELLTHCISPLLILVHSSVVS